MDLFLLRSNWILLFRSFGLGTFSKFDDLNISLYKCDLLRTSKTEFQTHISVSSIFRLRTLPLSILHTLGAPKGFDLTPFSLPLQ
jgi:hypothetical protein